MDMLVEIPASLPCKKNLLFFPSARNEISCDHPVLEFFWQVNLATEEETRDWRREAEALLDVIHSCAKWLAGDGEAYLTRVVSCKPRITEDPKMRDK